MILTLCLMTVLNEPIIRSAIIPGWGEYTLESKVKAETFFMVEGTLWLLYGGFHYYSAGQNHSAHSFAVEKAGANPANTDEDYLNGMEQYMSSDAYNEGIERDASTYYPDDLQRQQEYIQDNGFFGVDAWAWSNTDDFLLYWNRRKSGREAIRNASFCLGLALFNRVASIIDVAFFTPRKTSFGLATSPNKIGVVYQF